jgi:hypothetical protein
MHRVNDIDGIYSLSYLEAGTLLTFFSVDKTIGVMGVPPQDVKGVCELRKKIEGVGFLW